MEEGEEAKKKERSGQDMTIEKEFAFAHSCLVIFGD